MSTYTLPKYRHYKGGIYKYIGVCFMEKNMQKCVMYSPVDQPDMVWVRPYNEFFGTVAGKPRFELIKGE